MDYSLSLVHLNSRFKVVVHNDYLFLFVWGFCVPLFFMALLYQEENEIGRYKMTLKDEQKIKACTEVHAKYCIITQKNML